jgi:lysozyme family protein
MHFDKCMAQVWVNEGVQFDDGGNLVKDGAYSADGTTTRFGIAWEYNQKILKEYNIFSPRDMDKLTVGQAELIYHEKYWLRCGASHAIDINLAYQMYDSAVNQGVSASVKILQRVLKYCGQSISQDGKFGPNTRRALDNVHRIVPRDVLGGFFTVAREAEYYETLFHRCRKTPDEQEALFDRFEKSWMRRMKVVL